MTPRAHQEVHHTLIENHVGMALEMARRLAYRLPGSVSREDVQGAALLGLTEAACRYDNSRSEPFMAFACRRVRGAILDHLRSVDPMTRRGRRGARRVVEMTSRLEHAHGRPVTSAEVARELGMSEDEVHATIADMHASAPLSVEELEAWSTGMSVETPNECIERQRQRTALMRALETLDQRSVMILALCYLEGLSLREIGEILGVTESRVCQLRAEALRTLRAQLV